jgi:Holliday junction resolvase
MLRFDLGDVLAHERLLRAQPNLCPRFHSQPHSFFKTQIREEHAQSITLLEMRHANLILLAAIVVCFAVAATVVVADRSVQYDGFKVIRVHTAGLSKGQWNVVRNMKKLVKVREKQNKRRKRRIHGTH